MSKTITTKYIGATPARPPRIRATDGDGNFLVCPYVPGTDREAAHRAAAEALARRLKWTGEWVAGSLRHGYVFVQPAHAQGMQFCVSPPDVLA